MYEHVWFEPSLRGSLLFIAGPPRHASSQVVHVNTYIDDMAHMSLYALNCLITFLLLINLRMYACKSFHMWVHLLNSQTQGVKQP